MKHQGPIAIVGIGGIFPQSETMDQYWDHVRAGRDLASELPAKRLNVSLDNAFNSQVAFPDKVYSKKGYFVDHEALTLDYDLLDLDAQLVERLDPMFKLGLFAAQEAWADAVVKGLDLNRVGLIMGNIVLPTESASRLAREYLGQTFLEKLGVAESRKPTVEPLNAKPAGLPGCIIAKALGLGAGSYTLDAACASSLFALKLAADELLAGRADAMITGGLSRPDCLYTQMGFSQLRALSPRGVASPFDASADGLVVGEGCGLVVLKRLSDAIDAGDKIYGTIAGIGLSNDTDGSLLAPSSEGQLRAMNSAYEQAGWNPWDLDLVECHATGTPLGDKVEFNTLSHLWQGAPSGHSSVLGSVKSNVGHLLTAAGAAALIKALLAMKAKTLPPTANYHRSPETMDMENSPFRVLVKPESWPEHSERPRRFGVSAFGFGGTNAHVLIQEYREEDQVLQNIEPAAAGDIAIVALDAQFGPWSGIASFRDRVFAKDTQSPNVSNRWWGVQEANWFQGLEAPRGWQISEMEIPLGRFRIPPNELKEMLPQQLLMLLVADRALQNMTFSDEARSRTGVFVGLGLDLNTTHYQLRWDIEEKARGWARKLGLDPNEKELDRWITDLKTSLGPALNANRVIGGLGSITASRIAREYSFGGPSFTISSEETSGLRALEAAVRLLQKGELDSALVGAVDLTCEMRQAMADLLRGVRKPNPGDGAVALVLKRLDDAVRDGDEVFGVIKGIGVGSEDGAFQESLQRIIQKAEDEAGSGRSGYLEISGFGDFNEKWNQALQSQSPHLTDISDWVGQCGAASGLAGVLRAALACKYEAIPPINSGEEAQYWLVNRKTETRRAGVGCSGLGGNNAFVVLEQWGEPAVLPVENDFLLFVQADDIQGLIQKLKMMKGEAQNDLPGLAASMVYQPEFGLAVAFIVSSPEMCGEYIDIILEAFDASLDNPLEHKGFRTLARARKIFFNASPLGQNAKTAFVFPGSGSHFQDMGRDLALRWPHVFRHLDKKTGYLRDQIRPDYFWSGRPMSDLDDQHALLLSAQVALGVAMSDLVREFGVEPTGLIGYSLGESVANFAFNAWRDRDEMHRRTQESSLFTRDLAGPCEAAKKTWGLAEDETVDWTIGVVLCSADRVREALTQFPRAYLLIINTPQECVIGGDASAIQGLVDHLQTRLFPLKGVVTVHCEVLEPVSEAYRNHHLFDVTAPEGIQFYSCGWGKAYALTRESAADAIHAQARYGVDFPKTIEAAYQDGFNLFIEPGPGASCKRMINKILGDRPHVSLAFCQPGDSAVGNLLKMLGRLIVERVPVDLSLLKDPMKKPPENVVRKMDVQVGGMPFNIPKTPQNRTVVQPEPKLGIMKPSPGTQKQQGIPVGAAQASAATGGRRMPESTVVAQNSAAILEMVANQTLAAQSAKASAHEAFLRFSQNGTSMLADSMNVQLSLGMNGAQVGTPINIEPLQPSSPGESRIESAAPDSTSKIEPALDRDLCLEFAIGKIGNVLGPEFSEIDQFPTRVRLPDEPLMLVDRIMEMSGTEMECGRCVTEHDVLHDGWYLDCGRIPTCIAIEAGQADLFLSAFLGADFRTRGLATYRLLDAAVTFHGDLPKPGDVIRYDIEIKRFFRQANTWFFYFEFTGSVDGQPLLTMKNGCAGFFSPQELQAGKGVVRAKDTRKPVTQKPEDVWKWTSLEVSSYDKPQLDALREGDLGACFGPAFQNLPIREPLGLPKGRMNLVDRVCEVNPRGGDYGLGLIIAEADIHPDDWFLTCHFIDDKVMPGTLMYECCLHTMRVFLYRMGWVGEASEIIAQPVVGVASQLKCRGQVLETTKMVTYEVHIKEVGYDPEPYAIADALMYSDDKAIVDIMDMCIRFSGLSESKLHELWKSGPTPLVSQTAARPCFSYEQLLAFAVGKPSEAFGDRYIPFDEGRKIARFPGPPFLLMSQINHTDVAPWTLTEGGVSEAQYNIPPDAWYFDEDRQDTMPYSVLLEVALQSCGWLAAYMGSALQSPNDLLFRNLGGGAAQFLPVGRNSGWLKTAVKVTSISKTGDIILLFFDYSVHSPEGLVFKGDTYFGFFTEQAMAKQVGVSEDTPYEPDEAQRTRAVSFPFPDQPPFPNSMMRMVDQIDLLIPDGGPHGLGFIEGSIDVDPSAWFFKAHFKGDPVWPGSLGLEGFIQILKAFAKYRWGVTPNTEFRATALNTRHGWSYRGQIVPSNKNVRIQASIKAIDDEKKELTADGFLSVDGLPIYQMTDFVLGL